MIQIALNETLRQSIPKTSKLNSQGFEDLPVLDLLSRALPPQEHRQGIKFVPYYGETRYKSGSRRAWAALKDSFLQITLHDQT
jgi:hypothetical protein